VIVLTDDSVAWRAHKNDLCAPALAPHFGAAVTLFIVNELGLRVALAVCLLGFVVCRFAAPEAVWSLWLQLLFSLGGVALAIAFFVLRRRARRPADSG